MVTMRTRRFVIGVSCAAVAAAAVSFYYGWGPLLAQTSPKAHWEPYKTRNPKPSVDQKLTDPVLTGAIDLHAHHGPDSYDRQWDAFEVVKLAKERGMRGVVLKNHWTETAGLAQLVRKYGTQGIEVFGSVTLDTPVGGVNPMAVRYMADVEGTWGRIVWMPTHDSEHEVNYYKETRAKAVVSRNGKLIPEVFEVLDLIKERNLTLATGHVTPEEVLMIMAEAKKRGITRIIVTHPMLGPQFTDMSLPQMQEAVKLGGAIEITAGTINRDGPAQDPRDRSDQGPGHAERVRLERQRVGRHSQPSRCLGHGREIAACRRVQRTGSEPDVQGDARPPGRSLSALRASLG